MKKLNVMEVLKKQKAAAGCIAMAAVLAVSVMALNGPLSAPEFPTYTDPVMEVSIEDEETPLASKPKVSTKTSTKTKSSKKYVSTRSAAKKSYTKKLPTVKKTSTKTSKKSSTTTVKVQTAVSTAKTEKYKKRSKKKLVTTTVTTKTTTTTTVAAASSSSSSKTSSSSRINISTSSGTTAKGKYTADVSKIAPKMKSNVLSAYKKLGFTVTVDSAVSYAGYFNSKDQKITLKKQDDTVYHELGHFIAFVAGNADKSSSFISTYNAEKSKYKGVNKAYATQNYSEYFAESVKDYIVSPATLKSARPRTYAAVQAALNKITDAQVANIKKMYAPWWK